MAPSRIVLGVVAAVIIAAGLAAYYIYSLYGQPQQVSLRVSTTTSLYATGLLDYLASEYRKAHSNVRIEYIAVGTGAALRIAEQGNTCMVFVHAPSLEKQYLDKGFIEGGRIIAYNFFILVGSKSDPAGVNRSQSVLEAFKKIYQGGEEGRALFVSRGDNSGTHVKELSIWNKAKLAPKGRGWYKECGCGMDQDLVMSNELGAYSLSDMGTYLQFKRGGRLPNLEILYANATDLDMINIYSVYLVRGCAGAERSYAEDFAKFIYENQGRLIGIYGVNKYGEPLFYPAIDRLEELKRIWGILASGG